MLDTAEISVSSVGRESNFYFYSEFLLLFCRTDWFCSGIGHEEELEPEICLL